MTRGRERRFLRVKKPHENTGKGVRRREEEKAGVDEKAGIAKPYDSNEVCTRGREREAEEKRERKKRCTANSLQS